MTALYTVCYVPHATKYIRVNISRSLFSLLFFLLLYFLNLIDFHLLYVHTDFHPNQKTYPNDLTLLSYNGCNIAKHNFVKLFRLSSSSLLGSLCFRLWMIWEIWPFEVNMKLTSNNLFFYPLPNNRLSSKYSSNNGNYGQYIWKIQVNNISSPQTFKTN